MPHIVYLLVLCVLQSLVQNIASVETFQANFIMNDISGNSMANGAGVFGEIFYDYAVSKNLLLNFTKFNYRELFVYNTEGSGIAGQYIHRISPSCGGKCESAALQQEIPVLFYDDTKYTATNTYQVINNKNCTRYIPKSSNSSVTSIWFSSDSTTTLCRFSFSYDFSTNRVFTLTSSPSTIISSVFTPPTNCKCGQIVDVILVLDGSSYIDDFAWLQVNRFAQSFSSGFSYGPLGAGLGVIQFSTISKNELILTQNAAGVLNKFSTPLNQMDQQTCISCGIGAATIMLQTYGRSSATPIIVTVTGGVPNEAKSSAILENVCNGDYSCELQDWMSALFSEYPNAITYAVGVGVGSQGQGILNVLSGGNPSRVLQFTSFSDLSDHVTSVVTSTCNVQINSATCGQCCGFCTCTTCNLPETCDDGDLCTNDSQSNITKCCNVPSQKCTTTDLCTLSQCDNSTGTCVESNMTCTARTCLDATCNPMFGCQWTAKCYSPNPCEIGTCDPLTETCTFTAKPCGTDDNCTKVGCDPSTGFCFEKDLICDDNDLCTIDYCNPVISGGCVHENITCSGESNQCYRNYSCNPTTGLCEASPISCDDFDYCTNEYCHPESGCVFKNIKCPPNGDNLCLIFSSCDKSFGCVYSPKNCSDEDPLTYDICDELTGNCSNPEIPCASASCEDISDACITYTCNASEFPIDNCNIATETNCDDNNVCTIDICDTKLGCQHTLNPCQPPAPCSTVTCDHIKGCISKSITCEDENPCTLDFCDNSTGQCTFVNFCGVSDLCFTRWCEIGVCKEVPKCLVSKDACFSVTCNSTTGCEFSPKCTTTDPCLIAGCQSDGTCTFQNKSCDDQNMCTIDSCLSDGNCSHSIISCDDNDLCTSDSCDPLGGCVHNSTADLCNDYNACTLDTCNPTSGCVHTNITCANNNNCTTPSCDSTFGCIFTEIECPNSACEIGYCRLGVCRKTQSACAPKVVIFTVAASGVGIVVAIILAVIVCICVAAHGTGYYHGLHAYAYNKWYKTDDSKQIPLESNDHKYTSYSNDKPDNNNNNTNKNNNDIDNNKVGKSEQQQSDEVDDDDDEVSSENEGGEDLY